ncbi:MAG: hypothetical protein ACE5R6_01760 [Candidatus Heimdallarchaeota archaeon]
MSEIPELEEILSSIETATQSLQDVHSKITPLRDLVIKQSRELEEKLATIRDLDDKIKTLENRSKALENERKSLTTEKSSLEDELHKKAADYDALLKQFESISTEFKSIQAKEEATLDVRQLLSLYVALLEDIYAARPHIRILWLLHGAKGAVGMTRQEITKTSGYEPAVVLAAVHDLANAGFIGYNAETQLITLQKRIFE